MLKMTERRQPDASDPSSIEIQQIQSVQTGQTFQAIISDLRTKQPKRLELMQFRNVIQSGISHIAVTALERGINDQEAVLPGLRS